MFCFPRPPVARARLALLLLRCFDGQLFQSHASDWARVVPGRGLRRAAHGCAAAASQPWVSTGACAALPRVRANARRAAPGWTAQRADRAGERLPARSDSSRRPTRLIPLGLASENTHKKAPQAGGAGGARGTGLGEKSYVPDLPQGNGRRSATDLASVASYMTTSNIESS